jgi:hypothetical protein
MSVPVIGTDFHFIGKQLIYNTAKHGEHNIFPPLDQNNKQHGKALFTQNNTIKYVIKNFYFSTFLLLHRQLNNIPQLFPKTTFSSVVFLNQQFFKPSRHNMPPPTESVVDEDVSGDDFHGGTTLAFGADDPVDGRIHGGCFRSIHW